MDAMGWISLVGAVAATATLGVTIPVLVLTHRQEKRANERSVVLWRADEESPGTVRITNEGLDTAYDVTAEAWDRHEADTEVLAEIEAGDFVTLELTHRSWFGPDPTDGFPPPLPPTAPRPANPETTDRLAEAMKELREHERIEAARNAGLDEESHRLQKLAEARQVHVRVTWRAKLGTWSSTDVPITP